MMDLALLPKLPLALSQATLFGALVIAGLAAGEALRRYTALPRITGYVLAGAALGPQALGLISDNMLFDLRPLIDLSIGLIVFELGFRLDNQLRHLQAVGLGTNRVDLAIHLLQQEIELTPARL